MKIRFLYAFLLLFIFSCHKSYLKEKENSVHYAVKDHPGDPGSDSLVDPYKLKVAAETGKVIAFAASPLTRDGAQSTLGNFVCDALTFAASAEFKDVANPLVIVNRGGLRANLPEGAVKVAAIFELMPFENELVAVEVSGEKLLEFIPLFEDKKHFFSGLKIVLKNNKVKEMLINGEPLKKQGTYTIVTSDFLYYGGDRFSFLRDPLSVRFSGLKIRDAIIRYCDYLTANKKSIIPYTDERLEISG
jgi:2',3'-cyclic-nucleotide 2'-phosphodiesterase (5'-nucleotidase family)